MKTSRVLRGAGAFWPVLVVLCLCWPCCACAVSPAGTQASPADTPLAAASPTLPPAPTLQPTPSLPAPIPTPAGILQDLPEPPPEYTQACAAAFEAGGEVSQPLILPGYAAVVMQRDFSDDNLQPERYYLNPASFYLPDQQAFTRDEVRALVCIQETRLSVGTYREIPTVPGGTSYATATAWLLGWQVRVISYPQGQLLASKSFSGGDPPYSIDSAGLERGENYGSAPQQEAEDWAKSLEMVNIPSTEFGEEVAAFRSDWGVENLYHPRDGFALAFSPDSRYLALGLKSSQVDLFDLQSQTLAASFSLPEDGMARVSRLAFSADGSALVAATSFSVFRIDLASGKVLTSYLPETDPQQSLPYMPEAVALDGSAVILSKDDKLLWRTAEGSARHLPLPELEGLYYWTGLSSDGRVAAFTENLTQYDEASQKNVFRLTIYALDTWNGDAMQAIPIALRDWDQPELVFIPGTWLLAVQTCLDFDWEEYRCTQAVVDIWDTLTGEKAAVLAPRFPYERLVARPDGRLEGLGTTDSLQPVQGKFWEIWDTRTFYVVGYRAAPVFPEELLRSPDGRWLLAWRGGQMLKLIKLD